MVAEEDVNEGPLLHVARNVHLADPWTNQQGSENHPNMGSPGAYSTYLVKLGMVYWVYHSAVQAESATNGSWVAKEPISQTQQV